MSMNPEHESGNSIGVASTARNNCELLKRFLIKKILDFFLSQNPDNPCLRIFWCTYCRNSSLNEAYLYNVDVSLNPVH